MKTKVILISLILIFALTMFTANAEVKIDTMPAGGVNMINESNGKIYFQIGGSVYLYDSTQAKPFILEYEGSDKDTEFALVVGDSIYLNSWGESTIKLAKLSDGQKEIKEIQLFPKSFLEINISVPITFLSSGITKPKFLLFLKTPTKLSFSILKPSF